MAAAWRALLDHLVSPLGRHVSTRRTIANENLRDDSAACQQAYRHANADGPRDAASRKIDHIALPRRVYSYRETSVGR